MRQVLTDATCRTKPPSAGRIEIADLRQAGLVLRITANGVRSFTYRFRHPHSRKTLRATIGAYGPVTLDDARTRAREMAAQVATGVSPIDARRAERESASDRTFEALARRYIREHSERHKRARSVGEDRRNLATYLLPQWGKRDFRSIRRADAIELIESIVSTGKQTTANRVHTLISGIFAFAVDAELIETSPVARLRKRGKEQPRRRVLSDDEIRLFWSATAVASPMHLALRLALLIGARASEVTGARKGEFEDLGNSSKAKWTIPAERAKNAHEHLVPLAPLAAQTVRAAMALTKPNDEFVFPAPRRDNQPTYRHALPRAMQGIGGSLGHSPVAAQWRANPPVPHDLRRTCNSRLAELGIPKEIRDRCLNHITGQSDVGDRHYNLYEFEREKRVAMRRWVDKIATIVATPSRKRGAR